MISLGNPVISLRNLALGLADPALSLRNPVISLGDLALSLADLALRLAGPVISLVDPALKLGDPDCQVVSMERDPESLAVPPYSLPHPFDTRQA